MSKRSERATKKAANRVKSINDLLAYLDTLKACDSTRALKKMLKIELDSSSKESIDYVVVKMTKEKYLEFKNKVK